MAEVGLELDKADFAVAGYEVDERKYPRQALKEPSTGGKKKQRVDDAMTLDLSLGDADDAFEDEGVVQLGEEGTAAEIVSLETSSEEEDEAESEGHDVPLEGSTLGGADFNEEEPEELTRARFAVTPRKLFPATSQPRSSDPQHDRRPSASTPPNASGRRRSERIAQVMDRRKEAATGEPLTPNLVASQASVSETPDPNMSMNQMMMTFISEMRASQEQQRLDNESRLEE